MCLYHLDFQCLSSWSALLIADTRFKKMSNSAKIATKIVEYKIYEKSPEIVTKFCIFFRSEMCKRFKRCKRFSWFPDLIQKVKGIQRTHVNLIDLVKGLQTSILGRNLASILSSWNSLVVSCEGNLRYLQDLKTNTT